MDEFENRSEAPRVNDRRRFDPEGNPRADSTPAPATPTQVAEPAVTPAETGPAGAPDAQVQRLQAELEASRRRVDELARAVQALQSDRDEFKQRLTRERERMIDVERGKVALTVLEALDELDRCLSVVKESSPLADGVRLIREDLLKKVAATGIERVDLVGAPFDPNLAEAADMEITAEQEQDGRVVSQMCPAYRLNGRIVRPGRVKVAKFVQPAQA